MRLFSTPWTAASQASLSSTISWSFLKFMSIESVMLSNHLIPFSFCFQSFSSSRSFPMSWLFTSGGQSIGASASVLPMNIQGWFPLWLNDLNSLQYKGLSRIFSSKIQFSLVQLSSVSQSCLTLCNPMDCSTPGLPVHHQLSEFTQTHAHWSSDAIQPSYTLPSPSPPALNLSQHQGLFQWVNSSHQMAKVLEFQHQHPSFQWTLRTDLL